MRPIAYDEAPNLMARQPPRGLLRSMQLGIGLGAPRLDLGDPRSDHDRIRTCVQRFAVASDLAIALGDSLAGPNPDPVVVVRGLRVVHRLDRLGQPMRRKREHQPLVQRRQNVPLREVPQRSGRRVPLPCSSSTGLLYRL